MTVSRTASERLRVGIVGGGAITQVAHLPVLRKLKSIEVAAICDIDLPKARALADRFAVKDAFDDIEDLLRYEALDAVVICSPNHLHESHILAALSDPLGLGWNLFGTADIPWQPMLTSILAPAQTLALVGGLIWSARTAQKAANEVRTTVIPVIIFCFIEYFCNG